MNRPSKQSRLHHKYGDELSRLLKQYIFIESRWNYLTTIGRIYHFFNENEILWLNTRLNYLKMDKVLEHRIPGPQSER